MSVNNGFELEGFLRLDSEDFQRGADKASESTEDLADKAEESADRVESNFAERLGNVGERMRSIGTKMTAGITLPIAGIGFASIKSASRAEEAESRFNEVFANTADSVRQFANTFADEIGRSSLTIQNMAANFGSMLNPMIESDERVAELSQDFTKLTQDLASFENMDPAKVQRDLQSALAGQSETVRKYGVDLRQARIDQELMNMGIEGGTEAATRAQVAQARYNAIIADTQSAQNNAAKTSDSYANQQRALMESVKDLRVEIGQELLPTAKDLIGVIRPAVERFGELDDRQQKLIIGIGGVLAVAGPLLLIFGQMAIAASALAGPLAVVAGVLTGPVLLAIGAVIAAVVLLKKAYDANFLDIQRRTQTGIEMITSAFDFLTEKADGAVSFVVEKFLALPGALRSVIDRIPGVDGEDIIGDLDADRITDRLFPPPPETESEGEAVGEAAGEGVSSGLNESTPAPEDFTTGLAEAQEAESMADRVTVESISVGGEVVSGGDENLQTQDGALTAAASPTPTPSATTPTTSGASGGLSPSAIRDALEGMALELLGGEIQLTGDNATIQDVRAELRRAGREADNRGIR